MIVACVMAVMFCQTFELDTTASWETLANPWMTLEEKQLYETLPAEKKRLFQGTFVARRLDAPGKWPETGLFLPCFYPPKVNGDIRDAIRYLLGEPDSQDAMPGTPDLPRQWTYGERKLRFHRIQGNQVALDHAGEAVWRDAVSQLIKQPNLRYDFRVKPFGRTRVPDEISWFATDASFLGMTPEGDGGILRASVSLTKSFVNKVRSDKREPLQTMEVLVLLKNTGDETGSSLNNPERIRHTASRINLFDTDELTFEVLIPQGHFQADILVYSGFLSLGLRTELPITVLPPEMPRIGTPTLSQSWRSSGILVTSSPNLEVGKTVYEPVLKYDGTKAARVLVHSDYARTELRLQKAGAADRLLEEISKDGNWRVFTLPAGSGDPFRLLAVGYPDSGNQLAVSAWGTAGFASGESAPTFNEAGAPNYLNLEQLTLSGISQDTLKVLFVNDQALVGTTSNRFAWPSMDWGETASLRLEWEQGNTWNQSNTNLRRAQLFEELRVTPKYLVVGTKDLRGQVKNTDISFSVLDRPIPAQEVKPLKDIPKLWGIIVNDPLLKSPRWTEIREQAKRWFRKNLGPDDLVYVVHNANRPELLLAPTPYKPEIQAALDALQPKTRNENYFTVRYLIDALTHLKEHQSRPHQVLLMSNRLTDEIEQMEELLPRLRGTGLQIYNLEFPLSFTPESESKAKDAEKDALEIMANREEKEQQEHIGIRDNFQEQRNVTASWGVRFKSPRTKRKEREARIREQAFRASFDTQLASLTAGMSFSEEGQADSATLAYFFDELSRWQANLRHVRLAVPVLEEDMVKVTTSSGSTASWTLVEWAPN